MSKPKKVVVLVVIIVAVVFVKNKFVKKSFCPCPNPCTKNFRQKVLDPKKLVKNKSGHTKF